MVIKKALVTGSSNGIGEAIAKELAKLDYELVITGRSESDLKRVALLCQQLSPSKLSPHELIANLTDESDVQKLFDFTMERLNNELSLLVNNAGFGNFMSHTPDPQAFYDHFKGIMGLNLNSVVKLSSLSVAALNEAAKVNGFASSIINISSIASRRTVQGMTAYSVSKAAMNTLSDCLAVQLAPQIRVNCISPGPVLTKIIERAGGDLNDFMTSCSNQVPLQRAGQPEEVAKALVFLVEPETGAFITGANLTLDGGVVHAPLIWKPKEK